VRRSPLPPPLRVLVGGSDTHSLTRTHTSQLSFSHRSALFVLLRLLLLVLQGGLQGGAAGAVKWGAGLGDMAGAAKGHSGSDQQKWFGEEHHASTPLPPPTHTASSALTPSSVTVFSLERCCSGCVVIRSLPLGISSTVALTCQGGAMGWDCCDLFGMAVKTNPRAMRTHRLRRQGQGQGWRAMVAHERQTVMLISVFAYK
jgi:hypothetical protein